MELLLIFLYASLLFISTASNYNNDENYSGHNAYVLNRYYKEIYQKYEYKFTHTANNESSSMDPDSYNWLHQDAIRVFARLFREREKRRVQVPDKVKYSRDRRSGSPFITDDAYRVHCAPHICFEDSDGGYQKGENCHIDASQLSNGSCIYVPAVMLEIFLKQNIHRIQVSVVLVSDRLLDQSGMKLNLINKVSCNVMQYNVMHIFVVPDGQTLASVGMSPFRLRAELQRLHDRGILLSYHGVNTWWNGYPAVPRPSYLHCLPIGLGEIFVSYFPLFTSILYDLQVDKLIS